MKHLRYFLIALFVLVPSAAFAQGVVVSGTAFSATGAILPGAGVSLCAPVATTAATLSGGLATLTMASNPTTGGFSVGASITARTAGTSFTITFNGTIATNGVCGSFLVVN